MVRLVKRIGDFLTAKSIKRRRRISTVITMIILTMLSFIFLYPIFRMISYSFMSPSDLLNPSVMWIPIEGTLDNYSMAVKVLDYIPTLISNILVALLPTICLVASSAFIGWGIAMYGFKGKKLIFGGILLSFLIVPQIIELPQFLLFTNLHLVNTVFVLILPALFGQGLKSAIFILIFYRFFSMIPEATIEAAKIDGAKPFQIFFKLGIPSAAPAILISFLFSFVWYWNDISSLSTLTDYSTFPIQLQAFEGAFAAMYESNSPDGSGVPINEAISMAATILTLIPLLILYLVAQKKFINSADSVGITGE